MIQDIHVSESFSTEVIYIFVSRYSNYTTEELKGFEWVCFFADTINYHKARLGIFQKIELGKLGQKSIENLPCSNYK